MMDQAEGAKLPTWKVPAQFSGARLDSFLRHCLPHVPRRLIHTALEAKFFLLDGRASKKGDRLVAGARLTFAGPADWLAEQPTPNLQLVSTVIFEDDSILALDKPAGVPTHGFSGRDVGTLANWITAERPELRNVGRSRWQPGLLHRLDIETSGIVLVAKTAAAFERLQGQFRRREINKIYWALVWGDTDETGMIDLPLAHHRSNKRKMIAMKSSRRGRPPRSWPAHTEYRKIASAGGVTLLEVTMRTGVTHQIRVHLASLGFPVVGDELYGASGKNKFTLTRHFLHAKRLQFRHPGDDRLVELDAPLPIELRNVLKQLRLAD
jgi:23S rRNA pseudouridine1911/1915/1917 synthase